MKSQNERSYEEGDTLRERYFSAETGTSQKVRSQASTAESVKSLGLRITKEFRKPRYKTIEK